MSSQGPRYATSGVSAAGAAPETRAAWVNPGNAAEGASEPSTAEAAVTAANFDAGFVSEQLRLTGFGFTLPAGATINGVTVEVNRRWFAGTTAATDYRVQLWNDAQIGDNKAVGTNWPATLGTATYGSTSDGWNADLTQAIVNGSTFGVVLSANANAANTDIGCAWIRITVEYTEAPPSETGDAEVATATAAANPNTGKVSAAGTGAGAATGATAAAYAGLTTRATELGSATGLAIDATADTQEGAVTFDAEVATAEAAAIAAAGSIKGSLGFATGRSA